MSFRIIQPLLLGKGEHLSADPQCGRAALYWAFCVNMLVSLLLTICRQQLLLCSCRLVASLERTLLAWMTTGAWEATFLCSPALYIQPCNAQLHHLSQP